MVSLKYPNWHYIGSKKPIVAWISENLNHLNFSSALDLYGGSGIMSYYFLTKNKTVWYNDLLPSSMKMVMGQILNTTKISKNEFETLHNREPDQLHNLARKYFTAYFTENECKSLDYILSNFSEIYKDRSDPYRNTILYCIAQTCIQKQGKGSFHDNTMNWRNKFTDQNATWERSLSDLFEETRNDVNSFISDKRKIDPDKFTFTNLSDQDLLKNKSLKDIDLIYADPPFTGTNSNRFANYVNSYHIIDILDTYPVIDLTQRNKQSKLIKPRQDHRLFVENRYWVQPEFVLKSITQLIKACQSNILAFSYRDDALIPINSIIDLFKQYFTDVEVESQPHEYNNDEKESPFNDYLIIGQNE